MSHVVVVDGDLAQVIYVGHRIVLIPQRVEISNVGPNIYQFTFFDWCVVGVWSPRTESVLFVAIIVDAEIFLRTSIAQPVLRFTS